MVENLPSVPKPSLLEWIEKILPFKIPRIPLVQTAANLDKSIAAIVLAGGENAVARIQSSTNRITAKSSAEKAFIEFGQSQICETPGLEERALHYALGDAVATQRNREEILRIATEHLESDPPKNDAKMEIDEDWLTAFKRLAEGKSNADIQQLWGKILSSEIRNPGATSLRTLNFLATVSMSDAQRIVALFNYTIDGEFVPVWVYHNHLHPYGEFLDLQEIGVLSGVFGTGGPQAMKAAEILPARKYKYAAFWTYFDRVAIFETDKKDFKLQIAAAFLTEVGKSLFAITDAKQPNYKYFRDFIGQFWRDPVKRITIATITGETSELFEIGNEEVVYDKSDKGTEDE